MGEKFAANPVTGTGSMTVPIATSPGRSGFGPQLALSYDSGAGTGPFGFGWSLALPSLTRKTDKGLPQYMDAEESDTFILSGAEDLVPLLVEDNGQWARDVLPPRTVYGKQYSIHRYRPRVEGLFARIERWVNLSDAQDTFWRSISKDNITTWYGKTAESRIADPADPARVFTWLICESYDDKGNVIVYQYKPENSDGIDLSQSHEGNRSDTSRSANRYLKHVFYGNRTPYFPNLKASDPIPLPTEWCFELVFDYGEHDDQAPVPQETGKPWACRADPFSSYRATFEVRTYRLCHRALMFHHFASEPGVGLNCLVRSTDFTHAQPAQPPDPTRPFYSFLLSVTQTGYRRNTDGSYLSKALPPLEFAYTEATIDETVREIDPESLENLPYGLDGSHYQWVDLDGEGLSGILTEQADSWFYKPNLSPVNLHSENGVQFTLAQFGPVETVARKPSLATLRSGRQQLLDLAGDGHLDLVQFDGPTPGFFERTEEESWESFTPFASLPVLDWQNPNLKFVDLTGDGHADLLISEDDAFWWHTSLAAAGFGPAQRVQQALDEEQGPKLVFADGTESIFLADVSGDGLTDLVRIRNGEACYWPNLGYGCFGAKVTMDQSPWFEAPDLFDGRRIRLADIDGSGTADIVYFASSGVHLYFNQSGNAWGERRVLSQFPPVESVSSATALDLLGNGTACLAWSSPLPGNARQPMRYIDLMGGQKPHLLVQVTNNLGAETHIQFAPSTRFSAADKLAGTPWLTHIPFPVHVVERVETYDYVSCNRFVTRYAYHHGFYDGVEREFRGFGRVDQWDTEEFATLTDSGAFPQATNIDAASHVPPVWTKTWFHTGAYFGEARISKHLEQEYYREGDPSDAIAGLTDAQLEAMQLDDTVLPTTLLLPDGSSMLYNLSGEEAREACRALRGSILRQEIYALDGSDASDRPYSASERNYTIELLQPQGPNRYAVFFTHPRETIDFHYERKLFKVAGNTLVDPNAPPSNARDAADPRVSQTITLAVDPFGNVLQSVAVGYGRRYLDPALTPDDQTRQGTTLVTYTENSYTNAVLEDDAYRAPLPAEASTYELIQIQPDATQADVTNLFRFDEVQTKVQDASDGHHDILYENINATGIQAGKAYRRLIERVRTFYRPDDMGVAAGDPMALLPLRQLQSLALPGSSYKLAFTPGLLALVYQRGQTTLLPNPAGVLGSAGMDGGSYVDLDGDSHWWIPSGRIFYLPMPASSLQERTQAFQHFFLPRRFEDPFGNSTSVDYDDPHDLLVVRTVDAVTNTVVATNDYRVLQPALVTDPNGNQAAARFDVLGPVAGTAVMGKTTENLGDSLSDFNPDLTQQQIDDFYGADDPQTLAGALLGTASTRILYDVERFLSTRTATPNDPSKWEPVFAATLVRETHASDPLPPQGLKIQISFGYSDGFGREIQKKIQAEPGEVEVEDAVGNVTLVDTTPNLRWVGSGWTIFNNKGKPVRQYEPFFSTHHQFQFGKKVGVSPILFYDPVERVVATLHPNHTYEKVVFDPWRQETYDVNDTVAANGSETGDPRTDADIKGYVAEYFKVQPNTWQTWYQQRITGTMGAQEKSAAEKATKHANTPTSAFFDTLGRTFLTVAHNKFERKKADGTIETTEEQYPIRIELDIEGNQRSVTDALLQDALLRKVMTYDYDMLSNRIHQASMEAGERWMLNDVAGKPIRAWDSRDHTFRTEYDPLRRPLRSFITGAAPATPNQELLTERLVYGEQHPEAEQRNLRGVLYFHLDQAGVVTIESHDFKGNPVRATRRLTNGTQYRQAVDWRAVDDDHVALPTDATTKLDPAALDAALAPRLETDTYASRTIYDALNRPVQLIAPHSDQPGAKRNIIQPVYNEAKLLDRVDVWLDHPVEPTELLDPATVQPSPVGVNNIDYNAKGQRMFIRYANSAETAYEYDDQTFRLIHLRTTRPAGLNGLASQLFTDTAVVQDLHYTYDPVGNITHIADDALPTIQHNNENVEPDADYIYDAIYRLIFAHSREHIGQTSFDFNPPDGNNRDYPFVGLPASPNDPTAVRNYSETYDYDEVGNIKSVQHSALNGSWTRAYTYSEPSLLEAGKKNNRLTRTQIGNGLNFTESYGYTDAQGNDVHGCMTSINSMQMGWDFKDQLQQVELGGGGTAYYVYDANGQRVRKVVEKNNGNLIEERIYLGGFEVFRQRNGNGIKLERETLQIMDDKQRIALVETKTVTNPNDDSAEQLVRYQFGNHLGSASLELADQAQIISYEEYYPYGSTSYQAVNKDIKAAAKRYRYTGKERDEESGLYYHGARYYAPWLGRWASCDPVGLISETNLYSYVHNNPINSVDSQGLTPEDPQQKEQPIKPRIFSIAPEQREAYLHGLESKLAEFDKLTAERTWWDKVTDPFWGRGRRWIEHHISAFKKGVEEAKPEDYIIPVPTGDGTTEVMPGLRLGKTAYLPAPQEQLQGLNMVAQIYAGFDFMHGIESIAAAAGGAATGLVARAKTTSQIQNAPTTGLVVDMNAPTTQNYYHTEPVIEIPFNYSRKMARDPVAANTTRFLIEWLQEGGESLIRGSRGESDKAERARARRDLIRSGVDIGGKDAMHLLDSALDPLSVLEPGRRTVYMFGNSSTNQALGGALGMALEKYNVRIGGKFKLRFVGDWPSYGDVPPSLVNLPMWWAK